MEHWWFTSSATAIKRGTSQPISNWFSHQLFSMLLYYHVAQLVAHWFHIPGRGHGCKFEFTRCSHLRFLLTNQVSRHHCLVLQSMYCGVNVVCSSHEDEFSFSRGGPLGRACIILLHNHVVEWLRVRVQSLESPSFSSAARFPQLHAASGWPARI